MPHISIIYSGWVAFSAMALAVFQFIQFFFPVFWVLRDWSDDGVPKRFLTVISLFFLIVCFPGALTALGIVCDGLRNLTYQSFSVGKWWFILLKILGTLSMGIGALGTLLQVVMMLHRLWFRKQLTKVGVNFKWAWRLYIWTCYFPCFVWIIVFTVDKIIKSLNY